MNGTRDIGRTKFRTRTLEDHPVAAINGAVLVEAVGVLALYEVRTTSPAWLVVYRGVVLMQFARERDARWDYGQRVDSLELAAA